MISDDTLILYFYQDGLTPQELHDIGDAIEHDAALKSRYEDLVQELSEIDRQMQPPVPSHLKHQWHALIDGAAAAEKQKTHRPTGFSWLSWGASVTAALVVGIALGVYLLTETQTKSPLVVDNHTRQAPGKVNTGDSFNRGLLLHLQSSQAQLGQLVSSGHDDKQTLLIEIIRQNRMFEQAAEAKQAPEVARVLRAFEPILMELANDELESETAKALQRQLEFEMNIVVTKLGLKRSNETHAI